MRMLVQWFRLFRFPLALTAVGDAWAVRWLHAAGGWTSPPAGELALLAAVSFCLFSLGVVFNDVMDAGSDAVRFPARPIPSGAVSRLAAAAVAILLAVGAVALSVAVRKNTVIIAATAAGMIVAYDLGLKRVPAVGLLLLGVIRGVHCQLSGMEPAGRTLAGVLALWVSLFLFTHVAVVSWIAYEWEGKKPAVTTLGRWLLAFFIVGTVLLAITGLDLTKVSAGVATGPAELRPVGRWLVLPLLAGVAYLLAALWILGSRRFPTGVEKGRAAMRFGLGWLLVYDAAFLASAGRWAGAAAMAGLLVLLVAGSRLGLWLGRRAGMPASA